MLARHFDQTWPDFGEMCRGTDPKGEGGVGLGGAKLIFDYSADSAEVWPTFGTTSTKLSRIGKMALHRPEQGRAQPNSIYIRPNIAKFGCATSGGEASCVVSWVPPGRWSDDYPRAMIDKVGA